MDWLAQLENTDIPRGIFQGRVSSSGRLKLPAQVFRYLVQVGDKQDPVFVTTLDRKMVRIYSVGGWKKAQQLLTQYTADRKSVETVRFMANAMGRDSEVDDQGRVVIPAQLRRQLDLENKEVSMTCHEGYVTLYDQQLFEEKLELATSSLPEAYEKLQEAGAV